MTVNTKLKDPGTTAKIYAIARTYISERPALIEKVQKSVHSASEWLLAQQKEDGHWVGELEGDTILETEYVLLLYFLGNPDASKINKLVNYVIRHWQNEDGGMPMYVGGPSDVSASVKAYFACKLAGYKADEPFMQKMRECILNLGGVTHCNTFAKLYLSIFGQYDWEGVPTIPPEITLAQNWLYINIYEMSSWSRDILVPLAIINAYRPSRPVPPECNIDELYVGPRHGKNLRLKWDRSLISWHNFFLLADQFLKLHDRSPWKPLRNKAMKTSEQWMLERQKKSGGLGAIFPAMTHAVMAYKCLGYADDHPAVQHELKELEKFEIEDGDEIRMQPCVSPGWDTAISLNALLDSGVAHDHPAIQKSVEWLLSKQTTTYGDWAVQTRGVEPGGWYFEYENEFYPDIDDTIMVLMALYKAACPNGEDWTKAPEPILSSMKRALNWVMAMQNRNGGWASFDKDNDKMILQYVPFADHNAMLDPATVDITARALEMLSYFSVTRSDPRVQKALRFLYSEQENDGSWFGRWGVNYIYGTWQCLRGLSLIGEDMQNPAVQDAVQWLKSRQNEDGGWGESCRSYDDTAEKANGPSTASQTAWAVMGLINAGEVHSESVRRGFEYLVSTQTEDGTWDERWFTGTGFPRVFYLRYHLYRHYFPLWAMAQYLQIVQRDSIQEEFADNEI
jgi:squalene-hopene/tetraprenyl-beta-curcumene cyclase